MMDGAARVPARLAARANGHAGLRFSGWLGRTQSFYSAQDVAALKKPQTVAPGCCRPEADFVASEALISTPSAHIAPS